jgi:tetratricopeptide (TPR) repeat protein
VPDSDQLCSIKYRKARIYFDYNHIEEATPLYRDVVDSCRKSDLAIYSANLYIDCLIIKSDYAKIQTEVDAFLAIPDLTKDPGFVARLNSIKVKLAGKVLEGLQKSKKYAEAARYGIKLAEEHPDDPKVDVLYYDAGINFEKAKLLGLAIRSREALIKARPDSEKAKKAIYLLGRNYQDIAAFEPAAKYYEDFASKYPGEKEAPIALNTAAFFRRGLGDNDKSFEDTKLFTKDFGGRKEFIDQAAGVNFYEYQIYEQKKDTDGLQKHLQSYLKEWGLKGGVDRQIIAHAKIGEILWRESCTAPGGGVNGACIEIIRERAGGKARAESKKKGKKVAKKKGSDLPKQCGPATKSKVVVHDRKPGPAKEAMAHFAEALKLWKGGLAAKSVPGKDEGERASRAADMTYYAGQARIAQVDQDYEKFLRLAIPDKLDFTEPQPDMSPAKAKAQKAKVEASNKAFKSYFVTKDAKLTELSKAYQGIILFAKVSPSGGAHYAIASTARVGQLYQDFSGQLYTAPVPKAPPGIDEAFFHDAYCDKLTDYAEPMEKKATGSLEKCLEESTQLSWFNEWSQLCEAELNQIDNNGYPLAAEIRAEPGYSSVSTDRADVQTLDEQ